MILKCKMCGGNLEPVAEENVLECEYCGTRQTVATADNEKKDHTLQPREPAQDERGVR